MNFQIQLIILLIHVVLTFYYPIYPYLLKFSKTSTLIDKIFSNLTSLEEIESDNVTSTFLDHLPQFIFSKDFFTKILAA